jgi:hypothetical protein
MPAAAVVDTVRKAEDPELSYSFFNWPLNN